MIEDGVPFGSHLRREADVVVAARREERAGRAIVELTDTGGGAHADPARRLLRRRGAGAFTSAREGRDGEEDDPAGCVVHECASSPAPIIRAPHGAPQMKRRAPE